MIYFVKETGSWVISAQSIWLPGSYATKGAAHLAFRLSDEQKAQLSKKINRPNNGVGRGITVDDVRQLLHPTTSKEATTEREA